METIRTTALLRSVRILRKVLETGGHLLSLKLQWETNGQHWCEKLEKEKINYIKALIEKTQQNSKCRYCDDRVKTINHIRKYSKLAQKEFSIHWSLSNSKCPPVETWLSGKVIHWELCKKFKFDHTSKWYMHNWTSILEDTSKLQWNFDI